MNTSRNGCAAARVAVCSGCCRSAAKEGCRSAASRNQSAGAAADSSASGGISRAGVSCSSSPASCLRRSRLLITQHSFSRARVIATYHTRSSSARLSCCRAESTAAKGRVRCFSPASSSRRHRPMPACWWNSSRRRVSSAFILPLSRAKKTTGNSSPLELCTVISRTPSGRRALPAGRSRFCSCSRSI